MKPLTLRRPRRYLTIAGMILSGFFCNGAFAKDSPWWFEVEVVLFSHLANEEGNREAFSDPLKEYQTLSDIDLITQILQPDLSYLQQALKHCPPESTETDAHSALRVEEFELPWEQEDRAKIEQFKSVSEIEADQFILQTSQWSQNDWDLNSNLYCYQAPAVFTNPMGSEPQTKHPLITKVPSVLTGLGNETSETAYLLPESNFALSTLFRDLKRSKDKRPLLHLAWRQPVTYGRSKGQTFRLFGGQNFHDTYLSDGNKISETPDATEQPISLPIDLMTKINNALNEPVPNEADIFAQQDTDAVPVPLAELWELDGRLKIYLQRIGRVPYLHIESDFQFRTPTSVFNSGTEPEVTEKLVTADFKQLRRVISKQIHYFDHPSMGMVVQIRRYHRPVQLDKE